MKEVKGDIWEFHADGEWIVIPTNGDTNRFGLAVMGRGLAKEATKMIPGIAYGLAQMLNHYGNHVAWFTDIKLIAFPVKHHWHEEADLDLIRQSAKELVDLTAGMKGPFYLPMVGCGNGRRKWDEVRPILAAELDDRFFVITEAPIDRRHWVGDSQYS
jgi:hypothetical protein